MARPSKYRDEFCHQALKLCELGSTDAQLGDFFGVSEQTINAWKKAHPEFLESLKAGKANADNLVQDSLYRRALGYTHPEEKIFCQNGEITRVNTNKHYPPDTTAAIFWLKNRRPDEWRDVKAVEMSGEINHMHAAELSDEQLANIATRGRDGASEATKGKKQSSIVH